MNWFVFMVPLLWYCNVRIRVQFVCNNNNFQLSIELSIIQFSMWWVAEMAVV